MPENENAGEAQAVTPSIWELDLSPLDVQIEHVASLAMDPYDRRAGHHWCVVPEEREAPVGHGVCKTREEAEKEAVEFIADMCRGLQGQLRRLAGPEPERLEEIKDREKRATEGPWTATPDGFVLDEHNDIVARAPVADGHDPADSEFMAGARQDIPWLVEQLEHERRASMTFGLSNDSYAAQNGKLQAENERLEKELASARAREATPEKIDIASIAVASAFGNRHDTGGLACAHKAIARAFEPMTDSAPGPESITDGPGPTLHEVANFLGTAADCGINALDVLDGLRESGDLRKLADPAFEERLRARVQSADYAIKLACCKARVIEAAGGDLGQKKQVAQ